MARKFTHVLELMKQKGGRIEVQDDDLKKLLGRLMYRLPSYMSNIRRRAAIEVKAIRDGRKVIAYELPAFTEKQDPASNDTPAQSPASPTAPAASV